MSATVGTAVGRAVGGAIKPYGLDPRRAVQVITTRGADGGWRGSGYQVTRNLVLTAAHVVCDATKVQVRFLTEGRRTRELYGKPVWTNLASDIALISIADDTNADGLAAGGRTVGQLAAAEVPRVGFARIEQATDCEALGFPRFRLRTDAASSDRGANAVYRDSHHARGDTTPLSNHIEGSLEISLKSSPEYDPEQGRSPWEGMSGAPVWSGGYVIGVITKHHLSDGLSTLAASPVDRWYEHLAPDEINELNSLIGLPACPDHLVRLPRSSPLPDGRPELPELREAAERLASKVAAQWRKEERRRKVHDPFPLPVRFRNAETCRSDHWAKIRDAPRGTDPGALSLAGSLDQIVEVYRSIPSRRLVVLGAAGSGKTILTLRFVLDWLDDRTPGDPTTPGDPVPVIFSLGSWDPTAISLRDWMCRQLVRDYGLAAPAAAHGGSPPGPHGGSLPGPHGGNLAGALVDAGRILPVLDGFDEIASGLRGAALKELDRTTIPLLLTSRPRAYADAVEEQRPLPKAAIVELNGLTLRDIADYLPLTSSPGTDGGLHSTVWEPVLEELRQQRRGPGAENVAKVLATPLMVAMARTIYSDTPGGKPADLLNTTTFATPEALQRHLLAAFTPAAYELSPTDGDSDSGSGSASAGSSGGRRRRHWNPDRAQYWLGHLAAHLDQLGRERTGVPARDLAWWQLGTTMRRSSRMLVIGFLAALALGVTTAIGNVPANLIATSHGLRFALVRGLVVGLLHGLVSGLIFGIVYGYVSRGAAEPSRVRVQVFGRTGGRRAKFLPRFQLGLMCGVLAALVILFLDRVVVESLGLADGLDGGLVGGLVFVPGLGVGVGLALGIMSWLEVPIDIRSGVSSSALLSQDRRNVGFYLLVWAVVFGVGAGTATGLTGAGPGDGAVWGLLIGLAFGIEAAFAGGLAYGLSFTAWGQWVALARIWLPLTGKLPWRLIAFLDDACERDVLRQAGAVYQFRHAELQDHLTQTFLAGRDV
ncbi:NACHT domain-containing protein [Streptomyces sp. NBC_00878]|uniref:NACHT domain-containing protein n=1 Tax=Streptomyces sp. NBC_00878 TaxID=2975854 RepID=UPI00224FF75E|nr:NACHT domain-containing protein [Streptomyces sp. NBC_00878]MCX4906354.1 NACHT domain-containing protein [Streptomyces sp. NBC_00878]